MGSSKLRRRSRITSGAAALRASLRKRFSPAAMGMASLSLFGAEGGALAQTTPQEPTLPEVRVQDGPDTGFKTDSTRSSTRTDTPLRDIPQFINIVPQTLIQSQNATTLQEALRNVPGISYGAAEGGTQANQVFFLRGFPLNQDIFIDGVRDPGEYNRDLFATESVEVLKGASALMFGRGSPGGLINQVSKVAQRLPVRELAVTLGSFDQKRATADVNFATGSESAVRLIGLVEESGSYRYPQDVERYGFAPSFWASIGRSTELTLSYYYLKASDVTDYGQPSLYTAAMGFRGFPPVSPRKYYGYEKHDFADYETNIATARVDHQFASGLSLRNTLRWANYKRESESSISTLAANDVNGRPVTVDTPLDLLLVNRNHDTGRTRDNDDTIVVNQTELVWNGKTGDIKHTVLAGLEFSFERLERRNDLLDANPTQSGVQAPTSQTPFLDPDPSTQLSYTKTSNLEGRSEADSVSVYVQDQIEFTPHWKALFGLRYEYYDSEARTVGLSAGINGVGPFGRTDKMLSGRAGVIWQPSGGQSYYVSFGNSYNPSGELGVYGGTGNTNLSAINELLDPEETYNYEVGAQWDIGAVQVRAAVFRNEKTNARMVDSTGTTVLAGKRRVDGIEFEVTGSITPNWDIYSGIAFMDGEIVTGPANVQGNTPLGVAKFAGNVWTVYRLGGGWEVGGGVRGQSGAWLTDTNLPGSKIPDYAVLDATVAYVAKSYEIRVNGYNLTDKTYYIGGYNNTPNRVLPGMPRAASVTFRYTFD